MNKVFYRVISKKKCKEKARDSNQSNDKPFKNPDGMFLIINQPLGPFRQEETLKYLLISPRLLHKEW